MPKSTLHSEFSESSWFKKRSETLFFCLPRTEMCEVCFLFLPRFLLFLMECPGSFQIKWISCFRTLKNLGSYELENKSKWMTRLILFYVGFLFKEQILTNNVSFKFLVLFYPVLLIHCFLPHCCWWVFLWLFLTNFESISFNFYFISVSTRFCRPKKFLPILFASPFTSK